MIKKGVMRSILSLIKRIFFWFHFPVRNYETYKTLDVLLIYLEEVGIKSFTCNNPHRVSIIFKDGTKLRFWNENRWYAWMSSGEINFSNGETLKWENRMPSREVVFYFRRLIRKKEEEEDITRYLPVKMIRKKKLKKLKVKWG